MKFPSKIGKNLEYLCHINVWNTNSRPRNMQYDKIMQTRESRSIKWNETIYYHFLTLDVWGLKDK